MIDDVEGNCEAAKKIGMQAVCYKDFEQFHNEIIPVLQ